MKIKSPEIYTHIYFYFEKNVGGSVNQTIKKEVALLKKNKQKT